MGNSKDDIEQPCYIVFGNSKKNVIFRCKCFYQETEIKHFVSQQMTSTSDLSNYCISIDSKTLTVTIVGSRLFIHSE